MHAVEIVLPLADETMNTLFWYSVRVSDIDVFNTAGVVDFKYIARFQLVT